MISTAQPALVLRHIRRLVDHGSLAGLTDAQLLERFAGRGDEAAFEAILRRHGPLVLGVCRRILRDAHLAEDAFQAAFLVLARKARAIRKHDSVGSWLFGVAYRLAQHARGRAERRRGRERADNDLDRLPGRDAMQADPLAALSRHETQVAVYDELAALPAPCRGPLILCDLQGQTHAEAARQLGFPLGTLKTRLARGRELLRDRLVRRGVTLSAGGVAALLATAKTTAAVPPALTTATVRAALAFTGAGGAVPAGALALAEAMLRTSTMSTLKLTFLAVLTAGLLTVVGQTGGPAAARADEQAPAAGAPAAQQAPRRDRHDDPLPGGALARLGTTRLRHGGAVTDVAFLPDGKSLISVGQDGVARQWEVATGRELRRFGRQPTAPPAALQPGAPVVVRVRGGAPAGPSMALSPDGKLLALTNTGEPVTLWDVATGKELGKVEGADGAGLLGFAPDGKTLAGKGREGAVHLWDVATRKERRNFGKPEQQQNVFLAVGGAGGGGGLRFAPDGKTVAEPAVVIDNMMVATFLRLWDVDGGKERLRIKSPAGNVGFSSPAFSHDGKLIAAGTQDGKVYLWDAATGDEVRQCQARPGAGGHNVVFAPDGKLLYGKSTGDGLGRVWDVATGKELRQFGEASQPAGRVAVRGFGGSPGGIALARDGKLLATAGEGSAVRLFDAATGKNLRAMDGHQSAVTHVIYADGGKTLLTYGQDRTLRRWDAATGREAGRIPLPEGAAPTLSPDGRTLASQSRDGVALWDVADKKELRKIELPQNSLPAMTFSADGRTLAVRVQSESVLRLYDVATGKERARLVLPGGDAPAPGGGIRFAAVGPNLVTFSPDGGVVAALVGSKLVVGNAARGHVLREIDVSGSGSVRGAAFSPDGRSLALDHDDNTVTVREVATGKERRRYGKALKGAPAPKGAAGAVVAFPTAAFGAQAAAASVAFSPDGRLLAKAGTDRAVYLWDVATGQEQERFTGHEGTVATVAYAPDGKTLASGSADTTALVWDVSKVWGGRASAMTKDRAEKCWEELAGDDAARAFEAINTLTSNSKVAVQTLSQKLKPVLPADAKALADLIAQLDSKQFAARQKAMKELEALGDLAGEAIGKALPAQTSLEARKRLESLLDRLARRNYNSEELRLVRAVEALERMGTTDARRLLRSLADGAPGALLTEEARASLARLER